MVTHHAIISTNQWFARSTGRSLFHEYFSRRLSTLRWSLDHIFHSTDFGLVEMKRLSHIGSDHFPIYVVLQTGRIFEQQQQELEQTVDDEQEAKEAIQDGIEKAEKEEKIVVDELAQPHKQAMEKESRQGVL